MLNEIRVNYDTHVIKNGVWTTPIVIVLIAIWIYFFTYLQCMLEDSFLTHVNIFYYIVSVAIAYIIKPFLIIFLFVIILGTLYGIYFLLKPNKLAVILNSDGVWFDRYGFVRWNNINDIFVYHFPAAPLDTIGIKFNDNNLVFKQATLLGKLTILYSRIFKYPVTLAKLDIDNVSLINYVKVFRSHNR